MDTIAQGFGTKTQVQDILAALGDVIKSQQQEGSVHEPTATEYFVVIFRSLASGGAMQAHLTDLLIILNAIVPASSKSIVREQFKPFSILLSKIIQSADSAKTIRLALEVLGTLLEQMETSEGFWGGIHTLKIINMFLGLLDDSRVKIRKVAQDKLFSLLHAHKRARAQGLGSYIGEFCFEVIRACTRAEYKRTLVLVSFLESSIVLLPNEALLKILEVSLKLPACNQPILSAAMLRMIDSMFQSPYLSLTTSQVFDCVRLVLAMPPETLDMEANTYYCTALASGLLKLHKLDPTATPDLLVAGIVCLVRAAEAEFTQIHCAVSTALKRLITNCFDDAIISRTVDLTLAHKESSRSSSSRGEQTHLHQVLSVMESLCQLRNQQAWIYVLDAVRGLFERIRGNQGAVLLAPFLVRLADVNQAIETGMVQVEPPVAIAVSDTLGTALRTMGVVNFLTIVPFTVPGASPVFVGIDPAREWILSIMHATLRTMPCSLDEFGKAILSTARLCNQAIQSPEQSGLNAMQALQVRNRVLQLWSLFPDFCSYGCVDVTTSFPKLARILDGVLKDMSYPELLPHIVSGLTNLARGARERAGSSTTETPEVLCLRASSTTFLPAVLEFLESVDISDSRFQLAVSCVAAWTSISSASLISAMTKRLLQRLLMSTHASAAAPTPASQSNENVAAGWMSILQAIIPHLPDDLIILLYKTVRPLLAVDESITIQKRAYHVLDGLLQTHSEVIHQTEARLSILGVISESLLTCHVSARNMRLRCIESLMINLTDEEILVAAEQMLGEVLICQKDSNQKTRTAAMGLLKTFVTRLPAQLMFVQLCSAVVGETPVMRSSGIIGICVLLLEKRSDAEILAQAAELLTTVFILLREECVEQTRAVLSLVRVCAAVLPVPVLESLLPQLTYAITSGLEVHKAKFSSRVRAILRKLVQRVGGPALQHLLPEPDQALLDYILKQARRASRKKQQKEQLNRDEISKMLGSDSEDSDEEDDEKRGAKAVERPKALRSSDLMSTSMPSTLDSLLEDQPASFLSVVSGGTAVAGKSRSKRALGADEAEAGDNEDDGEEYTVVVSSDGKVCINAKEAPSSQKLSLKAAQDGKRGARSDAAEDDKSKGGPKPAQKRQREREPGEEYRSNKAGGDVWKKGMLEPHAFIPLDPRLLSKKHRREAVSQFGAVASSSGKKVAAMGKTRMQVGNRNQRRSEREKKALKPKK